MQQTRTIKIFLTCAMLFAAWATASADPIIRYVRTTGSYNNSGSSWADAKSNLQDAINTLREEMRQAGDTIGYVYVADGKYLPTESTESRQSTNLNTAFMIYEGIHVYGGFHPELNEEGPEYRGIPQDRPEQRLMNMHNDDVYQTWEQNEKKKPLVGVADSSQVAGMWKFRYKTILSGNHSTIDVTYSFDSIRGRYNMQFPASSYHVVWFATNGEIGSTGHYKSLQYTAELNGVTIENGNAASRSTQTRDHASYGGGVYMVQGAKLENCIVRYCAATMRGGGVYMDGGGQMEHCFVHSCQATGVGIVQGYGGAVCIDYDGAVKHSYLTQSSARIGGGLSICHVPGEYPWEERGDKNQISRYSPYATACVISNNTSTAEGGGVYLDEGGTINHSTIVRNLCIGPNVMYYGRRHGRSGGVYIRNCGMMYNSVCWGNEVPANNNLQFAAFSSSTDEDDIISTYHCAFQSHDITDWTGVRKDQVYNIEQSNMPISGSNGNFPCFDRPSAYAGILYATDFQVLTEENIPLARTWHPLTTTSLAEKGVQVTEAVQGVSEWVKHAHTSEDVVGNRYEPVSSLGALVRDNENTSFALVATQSKEADGTMIPTLFVDPNRKGIDSEGQLLNGRAVGSSWDFPLVNMGDAVNYFKTFLKRRENTEDFYYEIDGVEYDAVQILVKAGVLTTAGPGNYLGNELRTASVRVASNMRLYAAYPPSLTGTQTDGRDPREYVTRISANLTGGNTEASYANNSAHVIAFINAKNAIVDGFRIYEGNAHNLEKTYSVAAGAGVLVNNRTTDPADRIDMTGNQLRNCVIANCYAPKGVAVYVNGEFPKADGKTISAAELLITNTVIRNNTADYELNGDLASNHGVITANGRAFVDIDHCTIVNNVGFPLKADDKTTIGDAVIQDENGNDAHGYIRVMNSIIFANGDRVISQRSELGTQSHVTSVNDDATNQYVFGSYNQLDKDAPMPYGFTDRFTVDFSYPYATLALPSPIGQESRNNERIYTRLSRSESSYPVFENPSNNIGHSTTGDKPLYGGVVSYLPLNINPCVNAAGKALRVESWVNERILDTDRSDDLTRDYGGAPDIGAIENTRLPAAGTVIYVTPEGAGKRDGSSWANAIAGNHIYAVNANDSIKQHVVAQGDMLDEDNGVRLISTNSEVGLGSNNGIPTSDIRYKGFGLKYIGTKKISNNKTLTTINDTTTQYFYEDSSLDKEVKISDTIITKTKPTVSEFLRPTFLADERYPYGEISGQSRSIWRGTKTYTPRNDDDKWAPNIPTTDFETLAKLDSIRILNDRYEDFVSGLQWAVEEASRRNHVATRMSGESYDAPVQVWVGAGKYTDYKGYIMRDSVSVYGGFPIGKYSSPGMSERVPLMADSNTVMIPKSIENVNLISKDYETILQISDISPQIYDEKTGAYTFNTAAMEFKDEEYAYEGSRVDSFVKVNKTVKQFYMIHIDGKRTDVTNEYIQFADFRNGNNKLLKTVTTNTLTDGVRHYTFGTADSNYDCWHISYKERENFVYHLDHNDNKAMPIYRAQSNVKVEDSNTSNSYFRLDNSSLTGIEVWQTTKKTLPAGKYHISFESNAGYRVENNGNDFDISRQTTDIYFHVIDGSDNDVLTQEIYPTGYFINSKKKDDNRNSLARYDLDFTLDEATTITLKWKVEDGSRNTKEHNNEYGTENGNDPDPLPCKYAYNNANCSGSQESLLNPNRRELMIGRVKLYKVEEAEGGSYVVDRNFETNTVGKEQLMAADEKLNATKLTLVKTRETLRKRVLTMPDICMPTYYGGWGNPSDGNTGVVSHSVRIMNYNGDTSHDLKSRGSSNKLWEDKNYREYSNLTWDGFTIRHGFLRNAASSHGGGAGVTLFENAHIKNCIITNNIASSKQQKGGGVFCEGKNATVENCFILNNAVQTGDIGGNDEGQLFAGGMFMYEGVCFNSIIANNWCKGFGNLGLCVGRFYNNTVAYNVAARTFNEGGKTKTVGGVRMAVNAGNELFMANCIIYGNSGLAVDITSGNNPAAPFINCYVQSEAEITKENFLGALGTHTEGVTDKKYGRNNIFLNTQNPTASNTPFSSDIDADGNYTGGAKVTNNFALRDNNISGSTCVNTGTDNFEGEIRLAVRDYLRRSNANANVTEKQITEHDYYKAVLGVTLPGNDVVYADRIQDCQVDIGAYEYDGTLNIRPDTTSHPGYAVFYVSNKGTNGGNASGDSPQNAACQQKLQKILDAAGRYKYALITESRYNADEPSAPQSGKPNKTWTVQVRLAGSTNDLSYTPTRSSVIESNREEDLLNYSFILPRGVEIMGGYEPIESAEEELTTQFSDSTRDPLHYRTNLDGAITSNTGSTGNVHHVLTFTENLFNSKEQLFPDPENLSTGLQGQLKILDAEDRAVVDGCFIKNGFANGMPDDNNVFYNDRIGGAAVMTDYSHIRNCVLTGNYALTNGGALYMLPGSLLSGSILRNNSADDHGGAIYIQEPTALNAGKYAHIFTSTICFNSAGTNAGGMWASTNVRVNSSVFWKNLANDYANVVCEFSSTGVDGAETFPFNYSAIESRRVEGQGNLLLNPIETEGVRWDREDPFESKEGEMQFFPIEMSSLLSRTGMRYADYVNLCRQYPTLASTDIASVKRMENKVEDERRDWWGLYTKLNVKDNDYIDIGARALNRNFKVQVDPDIIMHRLFVLQPEDVDPVAARRLQEVPIIYNSMNDIIHRLYAQPGSSVLNPMQFFSDALDYIVSVRKMANIAIYDPDNDMFENIRAREDGEEVMKRIRQQRNARFEVFLGTGEHTPTHNAQGVQNADESVRTNTFAIPEGVTVVGGIDLNLDFTYCQEGYTDFEYTPVVSLTKVDDSDSCMIDLSTTAGDIAYFQSASTNTICLQRPLRDYNLNSVIEPWELQNTTTLSGDMPSANGQTNVYHVITCFADSSKLGALPQRFTKFADGMYSEPLADNVTDESRELEQSRVHRTVILDGLSITNGHANRIEPQDVYDKESNPTVSRYNTKTYFRGGGVFVDGNWTSDFDDEDAKVPSVIEPSAHNIPIMVENCQFTNNSAGNGGAIYSNGDIRCYSSFFTQNYSRGPDTELDQQFIPWTAGGCIATNDYCGVVNCLFANNEAQRGDFKITAAPDASTGEMITDADERQGVAGVISSAEGSTVRAFNCDFVRNKAVLYPAIFNFLSNDEYNLANEQYTDKHFAFNCLFWGNEATGYEGMSEAYNAYKGDYFHYDNKKREQFVKLCSEMEEIEDTESADYKAKQTELQTLANDIEGLYFCAYEDGNALPSVMPDENDNTQYGKQYFNGDLQNLFSKLHGNHSVILASNNNVTAGPNFVQPSDIAGINGYMQNADWLPSRINSLTDAGWGNLQQTVERSIEFYLCTDDVDGTSYKKDDHLTVEQYASLSAEQKAKTVPHLGLENATFDVDADTLVGNGVYNFYALQHFEEYQRVVMPFGYDHYIYYSRDGETRRREMRRISSNPIMGVKDNFIDIGVYEYQYVQLELDGNEIDTVWICTSFTGGDNSGKTHDDATTNLTTALTTLLRSWNNHDKYVCFIGKSPTTGENEETGEYKPLDFLNKRLSFNLSIPDGYNIYLPDYANSSSDYGIRTIHFLGGYNPTKGQTDRDPEKYPVVFKIDETDLQGYKEEELRQMFYIGDMSRRKVNPTYIGERVIQGDTVVPVTFDGITFHNVFGYTTDKNDDIDRGGAALYYSRQRVWEDHDGVFSATDAPLLPFIDVNGDTIPKLTLKNCIVQSSGSRGVPTEQRSPAVMVEDGGGEVLVINSLFHSNAGSPLQVVKEETETVANSAKLVNITSALNYGHITLENEKSSIYNSLIWRDNYQDTEQDTLKWTHLPTSDAPQFTIGTGATAYNQSSTDNKRIQYNAVTGMEHSIELANVLLVNDNNDVFAGPNFVNANLYAKTDAERIARNFHVNPAVLVLSAADDTLYAKHALKLNLEPERMVTRDSLLSAIHADMELGGNSRMLGVGIERGAYECVAFVQRVLYVANELGNDGTTWAKAFGLNQLQHAIDVASVYTHFNPGKQAYVFVRQNHPGGAITLRDGVAVVGSIPTTFTEEVYMDGEMQEYLDEDINRYMNLLLATRSGISEPGVSPSTLSSLRADTLTEYKSGALIDGFEISNNGIPQTESPIVLNSEGKGIVMRNCIVFANDMSTTAPVADLQNGLLYNLIFFDNIADKAVKVGSSGLVLNCTVIAKNDDSAVAIDASEAIEQSVVNTITASRTIADKDILPSLARIGDSGNSSDKQFYNCNTLTGMFTSALHDDNQLELESTAWLNTLVNQNFELRYQLHQKSKCINTGVSELPVAFNAYSDYIHFDYDRDLLGNPRVIGNKIDLGCFETWLVPDATTLYCDNRTNPVIYNYHASDRKEVKAKSFTQNYGGNLYPHFGSVLYIGENANLVCKTDDDKGALFTTTAIRPLFTYVSEGGSLYGQGNTIHLSYLQVERHFVEQQYAMMALPFLHRTDNTLTYSYDAATDAFAYKKNTEAPFDAYTYNGDKRAKYQYHFQQEESDCWELQSAPQEKNSGWLLKFKTQQTDQQLLFTAISTNSAEYVYEENGELEKLVTLQQYDNRRAGQNGSGLNFTRQEDMGWNMVGQPWLVSQYMTGELFDDYTYSMHQPHVMYLMTKDGGYLSSDQILTQRSWDGSSKVALGSAFFTQTATINDSEQLHFAIPEYQALSPLSLARPWVMLTAANGNDIIEVQPNPDASKKINYQLGRDGVKWGDFTSTTQLYVPTQNNGRLSLLGDAPVETEIPLGVTLAEKTEATGISGLTGILETSSVPVRFSLPEPNGFFPYDHVWLLDKQENRTIDLLKEDYSAVVTQSGAGRFYLRIGGVPIMEDGKRGYIIYAYGGMLYVRGLIAGDEVSVYSPAGTLIERTTVNGSEYTAPLPYQSGYVVKVNDYAQKVVNL